MWKWKCGWGRGKVKKFGGDRKVPGGCDGG